MPYNQVLAQPVTNFYRGKAMRAAAGQAEQQSKLGDLAIERAELENAAMKNPQVDPLRELQIIRESAEVGRDMEAQGLMQYMEEVETLGEEKAQENATERLRRNQRVMKRINPNFEPLEKDTVWTLAGAKSAIMNADKVSDYLTGPGPDAPTTREVKIGEEVVTEEWRGGMWQEVGRAPRKEGVTVNVGGPVETKAEEEFGRLTGTAYSTVIDRGLAASEKAGTLRAMRENPAITGPTQDVRAAANALFSDLGIPIAPDQINQIANLSQYKGMVNQLVLIEQLKQKGPQTESDAKRIAESFGKTVNIQEANRMIVNYQLAVADRETLLAQMAEEYRERTGKIDGFQKEIREYVRTTPLASNNPKSGRLVFWNEFADAMREQSPGMSEDEIIELWREKYAGR